MTVYEGGTESQLKRTVLKILQAARMVRFAVNLVCLKSVCKV